jgi:hypothetical protein
VGENGDDLMGMIKRFGAKLRESVRLTRTGMDVGARLKAAGLSHLDPREIASAAVKGRQELCGGVELIDGGQQPGAAVGYRYGVVLWRGEPVGVTHYYTPPEG